MMVKIELTLERKPIDVIALTSRIQVFYRDND